MHSISLYLPVSVFYPELPGGLRQFYNYAPGLKKRGIRLRVVTPSRPSTLLTETQNGIRIIRAATPAKGGFAERENTLRTSLQFAYASRSGTSSVVQTIGVNWEMARLLREARQRGVGSVNYISMAPQLPTALLPCLRQRMSSAILLRSFDRLICCSSAQAELYRKTFWLPKARISIIPNGVQTDRFRPPSNAEREALRSIRGWSQDEVIFIYVGNIIERKGIELLIQGWAEVQSLLPRARLILLGSREMPATFQTHELQTKHRSFEARLSEALRRLNPAGAPVNFEPATERVEDYLRAADVFVFPSYCEGLPNALLEAMACGLPSLVAPFDGFPIEGNEIGRKGCEHLVVPHEIRLWAESLRSAYFQPEMRTSIGAAASKHVFEHHCYSNVLNQFASVYQTVAQHGVN
jgi:glycosyltransferase involved in cell wall biosynthesis